MNITLIGMPGSGKSVVGVILAKRLNMDFVDGDLEIQKQYHALLKDILREKGFEGFKKIENDVNCNINQDNTVISPGGSIVYCEEAMEHFKSLGPVVYLKISLSELEKRLGNLAERGVAIQKGMTLSDLYDERIPLYEKYADIVVDEAGLDTYGTMEEVERTIKSQGFLAD